MLLRSNQPTRKPFGYLWISCSLLFLATCFITTTGCKEDPPPSIDEVVRAQTVNIARELPWSERMALSVMKRAPIAWKNDYSKQPSWNYTHGLIMTAIMDTWEQTNKQIYFDYAKSYADTMILPDGGIVDYDLDQFNIDHINPGRILFKLYEKTGKENYKIATQTLKRQIDWQPRTTDGGFWHKLRYPWQMWLDGLYMGEPFYAEFALRNHQPKLFDDVVLQFTLMEKHARDPKTGLLYHGWDESRVQRWADPQTGCSPNFWGRAIGWYAMALVDVLDFLPADHPKRQELIDILNRTLEAVAKYQDDKTGLWYQIVDQVSREGNYLEASASCMFTYAMIKGVNKGYLPESYRPIAQKGYDGILNNLIEVAGDGELHLTKNCAVAGLGAEPYRDGSFEYYIGEPVRPDDPKGLGPFILASLEFERAGKGS